MAPRTALGATSSCPGPPNSARATSERLLAPLRPAVVAQLTPEQLLDSIAIAVDAENAWNLDLKLDWTITDLNTNCWRLWIVQTPTSTSSPLDAPPHQQVKPPSTSRSTPVQKVAASLSRKMAGPTSSSTVAILPSGVSASNLVTCSATSGRRFMGVAV
jgi:hypothetical protein